jgi:hypothetical protein
MAIQNDRDERTADTRTLLIGRDQHVRQKQSITPSEIACANPTRRVLHRDKTATARRG